MRACWGRVWVLTCLLVEAYGEALLVHHGARNDCNNMHEALYLSDCVANTADVIHVQPVCT